MTDEKYDFELDHYPVVGDVVVSPHYSNVRWIMLDDGVTLRRQQLVDGEWIDFSDFMKK